MRHEWVFDVLSDMLSYATRNGLLRLAEQVEVAIEVARQEISALDGPDEPPQSTPSGDRRMH
jgi:hypothetical protein